MDKIKIAVINIDKVLKVEYLAENWKFRKKIKWNSTAKMAIIEYLRRYTERNIKFSSEVLHHDFWLLFWRFYVEG